jgi:hypothetical protein
MESLQDEKIFVSGVARRHQLCIEDVSKRFEESGLNPFRKFKEGEEFFYLESPYTPL